MTRAIISVSNKDGLQQLARFLVSKGVEIISSGGTYKLLLEMGIKAIKVSDITGFPEILDGRVKTLHPSVHGGLLALNTPEHNETINKHGITRIDIAVINLYPFEESPSIETIDIGGPAMVRASAKNHENVAILTSPNQYDEFIANFDNLAIDYKRKLAAAAFTHTSRYDSLIANYLGADNLLVHATTKQELRYGENPHQAAKLYITHPFLPSILTATQLQGKELSYNNIADSDSAFELASSFTEDACIIVKHANPCGVAVGADCYDNALACDPISAFGGIVAFNHELSEATAIKLTQLFLEVIIAPSITDSAKAILSTKKNIRVLITGQMLPANHNQQMLKSINGGILTQASDDKLYDELKVVTTRSPSSSELADMRFAFIVAKFVKSNAIVYAKDNKTVGIGCGQTSRVDSAIYGADKAVRVAKQNVAGGVMASEAFLPFADSVEEAAKIGITAIIQPGGSIRDNEVIEAANRHGIAMVFTGTRHFKH
jgi:phosphoribosylaminoimidazolecarboxamide formyltransferase / IMP cyclohydrolase